LLDGVAIPCGNADPIAAINTEEMLKRVNQHDALTQINQELVDALNSMTNFNFKLIRDYNGRHAPWNQMDEEHLHDSHVLINKAKGLVK